MIATMTYKENSNKTYTLRAVPCEYLSFQERQRRRTTPSKDINSEDRSSWMFLTPLMLMFLRLQLDMSLHTVLGHTWPCGEVCDKLQSAKFSVAHGCEGCSNSCRLLFLHHFQRLGSCPQLSACRNGMNMARMFSLPSVRGQNLSASTHERWVQSVGLQGRTGAEPEHLPQRYRVAKAIALYLTSWYSKASVFACFCHLDPFGLPRCHPGGMNQVRVSKGQESWVCTFAGPRWSEPGNLTPPRLGKMTKANLAFQATLEISTLVY